MTHLHDKDCSKMHSGSCNQMMSSCRCPISMYLFIDVSSYFCFAFLSLLGLDLFISVAYTVLMDICINTYKLFNAIIALYI